MIYGRIYKIFCNITGECYYGSTKETLSRRLSVHKSDYKTWKKGKSGYITSFRIIERGNFTISLMEEGEFQNKDFMKARERHYIENFECVNKNVPNRTQKEYNEANREHIAEQMKKWREVNKEYIAEQKKKYLEANKEQIAEQRAQKITCVCGCMVRGDSKARHIKSAKHQKHLERNN